MLLLLLLLKFVFCGGNPFVSVSIKVGVEAEEVCEAPRLTEIGSAHNTNGFPEFVVDMWTFCVSLLQRVCQSRFGLTRFSI